MTKSLARLLVVIVSAIVTLSCIVAVTMNRHSQTVEQHNEKVVIQPHAVSESSSIAEESSTVTERREVQTVIITAEEASQSDPEVAEYYGAVDQPVTVVEERQVPQAAQSSQEQPVEGTNQVPGYEYEDF